MTTRAAWSSSARSRSTRSRPRTVQDDVLGGSASFFSTAASYFTPVKLVAVVGDDLPEQHLDVPRASAASISTGLERAPGKTFRWTGRYSDDLGDAHHARHAAQRVRRLQAEAARGVARRASSCSSATSTRRCSSTCSSRCERPRLVAMDTMNFWIDGRARRRCKRVLERVDLLVINDEEARLLVASEHNLPRAARAIRAMGPKTVIVKRGDSGALLFHEHGVFAAPAYPLERRRRSDRRGRHASPAASWATWRACATSAPQAVRRAMFYGAVMASFCVEDYLARPPARR